MKIAKEEIEAIKQAHDLRAVVEAYGVTLKKKGANYVGLCPFHKEKAPSFTVNPKTNLYHCFGCNAGSDVMGTLGTLLLFDTFLDSVPFLTIID